MGDSIVDVNTLFGPLPAASVDLTVEVLLDLMAAGGVNSACTLSTLGLLLDPNVGNAATRAACSEYPQLIPTATLNPTSFFGDAGPVQRLQNDGFRLVRFFPAVQEWPIVYQPFGSLLEILAESNLPIMINVAQPGQITALESFVGSYPIIVFSGVDPALLPEAIAALRKKSGWMMETSRLTAIGSIKQVVNSVGPERLLFGTGAPAQSLSGALAALQHAGITDEQRQLILSENAGRILPGV
jgi:predicted TIM-barrel fold metal-dependent hydrolase